MSSQDWPGEAAVDVSIVNWIKDPPQLPDHFVLDETEVEAIDTALQESTVPIADVPVLPANRRRAFQGFLPGAKFDVDRAIAERLLGTPGADYAKVVRPYLDGRDIARTVDQRPTRFVMDFGQMKLEAAMAFPAALDIVREQAKTARETSPSYHATRTGGSSSGPGPTSDAPSLRWAGSSQEHASASASSSCGATSTGDRATAPTYSRSTPTTPWAC